MDWLTIVRYWQETYHRAVAYGRRVEGQRDHQHARAMEAEFVLVAIAEGIPFRGESDPRKVARDFLGDKLP